MIQRFIKLGEGYNDLYELIEIAKTNKDRIHLILRLDTKIDERDMSSLVVLLKPALPGKMMPLYVCHEGIYNPIHKPTERYRLFEEAVNQLNLDIHRLEVKNSKQFAEIDLYYQYLTGVLRLNRYLPPMS
ncbi:DUF7147 family protein [Bacillus suaedae]|uniref:Methylthioribose kinase n=1 Tax=Halalkalibacter suaedae TaxID=2822140 RepID=A0A940WX24_9BACI|nr:methylthioribose kinase [Bacillus suaedae]MBP3952147.1 methylthioribose kinase [Bacillus suaedae]